MNPDQMNAHAEFHGTVTLGRVDQDASIRRILLVDDEIHLWWDRDLAALAAAGYHVDTGEDGEAAWKALQINDYDLLITDNKMPKLWGLELIKRLCDHGMTLPIIFASTLLPVIDPGQKLYFQDVCLLEKPVSASQLLAMIEKSRAGAGEDSGQRSGRIAEPFRLSRCCSSYRARDTDKCVCGRGVSDKGT